MAESSLSRRRFLKSLLSVGGMVLAGNLVVSCASTSSSEAPDDPDIVIPDNLSRSNFSQGVASFDPTPSRIILWTRYETQAESAALYWQLSTDPEFKKIIRAGEATTSLESDHTLAVEVQDLASGQTLYYRFINLNEVTVSATGETITLPRDAARIRLAVCSCSYYSAGLFNVYRAVAESDVDLVLHLGDYIYEYGSEATGLSGEALALQRAHEPAKETVALTEYRARYRQYRGDPDLQLAHQKKPFVCVWDDHEVANDTYSEGAQNHQEDEGSFDARKLDALTAYSEYLPARRQDIDRIYRSLDLGGLVNLVMLDTRIVGRDEPLNLNDYKTSGELDKASFEEDWLNPGRSMLGQEQLDWLSIEVTRSKAKWQVLGQQVILGKLFWPAELLESFNRVRAEALLSGSASTRSLEKLRTQLSEFKALKLRFDQDPGALTESEKSRLENTLPYKLDAWDGYPAERERLFNLFSEKQLICLTGDSHNAWQFDLSQENGERMGFEFAATSVTSPGIESYLGPDVELIALFEEALGILVEDLNYVDAASRGYLKMTFTSEEVLGEWFQVDTVNSPLFTSSINRAITVS